MIKLRSILATILMVASLAVGFVVATPGVAAAAYPSSGTVDTIGNRAIPGTTNSVSCWRTWSTGGVSSMSCYRYDQYLNVLSVDSFTLDWYCHDVVWAASGSILHFSNFSHAADDPNYPHSTWNGWAPGCYATGTLQSGSAGWYEAYTVETAQCDTSPLVTTNCPINNALTSGGIWINSPGVSRDVWSGYAAQSWPNSNGIYTRVIYTQ